MAKHTVQKVHEAHQAAPEMAPQRDYYQHLLRKRIQSEYNKNVNKMALTGSGRSRMLFRWLAKPRFMQLMEKMQKQIQEGHGEWIGTMQTIVKLVRNQSAKNIHKMPQPKQAPEHPIKILEGPRQQDITPEQVIEKYRKFEKSCDVDDGDDLLDSVADWVYYVNRFSPKPVDLNIFKKSPSVSSKAQANAFWKDWVESFHAGTVKPFGKHFVSLQQEFKGLVHPSKVQDLVGLVARNLHSDSGHVLPSIMRLAIKHGSSGDADEKDFLHTEIKDIMDGVNNGRHSADTLHNMTNRILEGTNSVVHDKYQAIPENDHQQAIRDRFQDRKTHYSPII